MKITDFIIESKVLLETRTPNQILLELNVINIPQIDTYLADIAQNLPTKETQKWFTSRAKKYLINSEEDNAVITHFSGKAEPWMKQRQKEGVKLYRFNPSHDLSTKLAHIVDWIRAMNDTVTGDKASDQQSIARAKKAIKGLGNTSITQAIALSNQWITDMNSGKDSSYKRAEDETGLVPVMTHGEYKWYKLTDQDCLDREGKVMGHCVASYGKDVSSGRTVIYSLRDNNNFAHATVEVKNGQLEQVKGKRNAPPVAKYQRATVALLNTLTVPPSRNGLRDIQGMDFLYNRNNHKYGTIQDVGDAIYNKGGISIWSIGTSMQILVGDSLVCYIKPSPYSSGLTYDVKNVDLMQGVKVDGAKYNDPTYKLAKFITQVIPPPPSDDVDLTDLKGYCAFVSDGTWQMFEDMGNSVYVEGEDELRYVSGDDIPILTSRRSSNSPMYMHMNKGRYIGGFKYNKENKNIGDKKTITSANWQSIVQETTKVLAKYINTLKQKDRPIIQDLNVYQHPKTLEASTEISASAETIITSKSGDFGWYKVINSSESQNNRRGRYNEPEEDEKFEIQYRYILVNKNKVLITINVDANDKMLDFHHLHSDAFEQMSQADVKEVANLFNKSGLNKYYPFTDNNVVSSFEEKGLYFLREKRMFTTDHSIAGEQFQHDDKEFKAIKTHNHLKIYYKDAEVVVFDLKGSNPSTVSQLHLKNKLLMLNNVRKIADVLNHYEIHRGDKNDYNIKPETNTKIAQAGLTYSYDNGWKGMKSGPKPVETNQGTPTKTIGKEEYEMHSFKRDFLIQNANTHELVATFKGHKEVGNPVLYINAVKMENQSSASFDIVADALNELNQRDDITVQLSSEAKRDERRDFNNKMHARGYTGTKGTWKEIAEEFPTEVISKGAGGTWVKEAFTDKVDPVIKATQDATNDSYSSRQTDVGKALTKYDRHTRGLDGGNYTLYSRKTPVLRAFVSRGNVLQVVYKVTTNDQGETDATIVHSQEVLLKHGNAIGRLLHKINGSGGVYLTDHNIYLAKGKLADITKNPKLAGFVSGEIIYEDGHKWQRGTSTYNNKDWTLSLVDNEGRKFDLINAKIDDNGLETFRFVDSKVRKYTKLYRPFLNDLMDIVDQLYGSD